MYVCPKCGHEDRLTGKPNYCGKCGRKRNGFINPSTLYYHYVGHVYFAINPTFAFVYERVFELLIVLGIVAIFYFVVAM